MRYTCTNCPCQITRDCRLCDFCAHDNIPQQHSNLTCCHCHQLVCVTHSTSHAVAQGMCQVCFEKDVEERICFEDDEDDDDGGGGGGGMLFSSSEDEEMNENNVDLINNEDDTTHLMFRRILPSWLQRRQTPRSDETPLYIPSYSPRPPPPRPCFEKNVNLELRETCAVCLVDFKKNESVQCLTCHDSHMFHKQCIETWWKQTQPRQLCPLCNQ